MNEKITAMEIIIPNRAIREHDGTLIGMAETHEDAQKITDHINRIISNHNELFDILEQDTKERREFKEILEGYKYYSRYTEIEDPHGDDLEAGQKFQDQLEAFDKKAASLLKKLEADDE